MADERWVFDRRTWSVVLVPITSMEQPGEPSTKGLVRVGHLGVGSMSAIPESKPAAIAEGLAVIDGEIATLQEARRQMAALS